MSVLTTTWKVNNGDYRHRGRVRRLPDTGKVYALLFSHVIDGITTYPEWVGRQRFSSSVMASRIGDLLNRNTGAEYEIMIRRGRDWVSARGESPKEVIKRRWSSDEYSWTN